jgi:hypothetical protein
MLGLPAAGCHFDEGNGRVVVDRVGIHRLDDGDVVDDLGRMRQQLAEPGADLPCCLKLKMGAATETNPVRRSCRDALAAPDGVGSSVPCNF